MLVAPLASTGVCPATRDNDVNLQPDQLGRKRMEPIGVPFRGSILNDDVLPFHVTQLAQALPECLSPGRVAGSGDT